jgi:hypothetical protein
MRLDAVDSGERQADTVSMETEDGTPLDLWLKGPLKRAEPTGRPILEKRGDSRREREATLWLVGAETSPYAAWRRDPAEQREVVHSHGAQHIMVATVLGQASNDTFYMAREDGCARWSTNRTYRAVGMVC